MEKITELSKGIAELYNIQEKRHTYIKKYEEQIISPGVENKYINTKRIINTFFDKKRDDEIEEKIEERKKELNTLVTEQVEKITQQEVELRKKLKELLLNKNTIINIKNEISKKSTQVLSNISNNVSSLRKRLRTGGSNEEEIKNEFKNYYKNSNETKHTIGGYIGSKRGNIIRIQNILNTK